MFEVEKSEKNDFKKTIFEVFFYSHDPELSADAKFGLCPFRDSADSGMEVTKSRFGKNADQTSANV